jgi:hypothetical protein
VKARGAEVLVADHVLDEARHHAQTGERIAEPPGDAFGYPTTRKGRNQRAEVDAHIENGEAGIAATVAGLVELAYDGAYVRFEQTGADNDKGQPQVEHRQSRRDQAELAGRDQDAAI